MYKIKLKMTTIENQQVSVESWIEKYLPLRLHHQVTELLEDVISAKKRERLLEISRTMAGVLRKEIIEDQGYSRLKDKCLKFITDMRLEQKMLNDAKTAKRTADMRRGASIKKINEDTPMEDPLKVMQARLLKEADSMDLE